MGNPLENVLPRFSNNRKHKRINEGEVHKLKIITMETERKRTLKQNKSIHKFFEEASVELNNADISLKVLLETLEVEHTAESVKSIFRAIGRAKFGKVSTADLTTKELNETFEELARLFAKNGIHILFPSVENSEEYLESFV